MYDDTIIVFLSDNGMAFPFAKTNCYLNSNRTPMIVRAPGTTKAGEKDSAHYVSGIDFMPTMLELLELPIPKDMDGRSYAGILKGQKESGWEDVYTQITSTARHDLYPMRAIQDAQYAYIFNDWSDGSYQFMNESKNGRTYQAMVNEAKNNDLVAARVQMYDYRSKEELYDLRKDPDALENLIDKPKYQKTVNHYRHRMLSYMESTKDEIVLQYRMTIPGLNQI